MRVYRATIASHTTVVKTAQMSISLKLISETEVIKVIVNIANHGGSIVWEGIYYFALADYPNISDVKWRKCAM